MKKKTFGRIAAVGLAGLTAVPAIAIVASADVSVDNINKTISGTAYYFTYSVTKTTYESVATYNPTSHTVSFNDAPVVGVDYAPTSIGNYTPLPKNGAYYTRQDIATTQKSAITNAVTQANNFEKTSTLQSWKNDWIDFAYYEAHETDIKALEDGKVLKSSTGTEFTNKSTNPGEPGDKTKQWDQYTSSVNIETKTMKQLAEEVGNKTNGNVAIDSTGEITGGNAYSCNTTGGGTTNGSTSVGGYSQYVIPSNYRYATSTSYYSYETDTWYPNTSSFYVATGHTYSTVYGYSVTVPAGYRYSSARYYFDPTNGYYYTLAEYNSGICSIHAVPVNASATTNTENAIYKVTNGLYYYTWSSAYAAAGYDESKVSYISSYSSLGNYFSRLNGNFYSTYAAALSASNGNSSYVVTISGGDYYDYLDPYYYYYMQRNSSNSSSSSLGGASVKIGNKSGWTNVRTSIRNAAAGATLNVSLNGETYIPSEILTALDGKNVTVNFTLSNGSVISFNGKDISSPKDINVNVAYNTKNISTSLVNKAKSVNNAVSSAQISISNNTFGGSASLTVKFSANRSGYTAKIYRYNSTRNSLQLVDTSKVTANGKVTFDGVTQGGDYVVVLC